MLRALCLICLGLAVIIGAHGLALADLRPPPTPAEVEEAKKFFEAGLEFHKQRRFDEALASFGEANRRVPRASTQRNIAQTYRDMNDMASAYMAYESLLLVHGDSLKPADRAEIDRALAELAVVTGLVMVTVPDDGATVIVDGKELGSVPRTVRLNLGAHTVVVTKREFEDLEQKVTIVGRDVIDIKRPLVPLLRVGHLTVVVEPADSDVTVFVDEKAMGLAPWEGDVPLGEHRVSARGLDVESAVAKVTLAGRDALMVKLPLHRVQGTLHVRVDVLDADIALDGMLVGRTTFDGPVARGKHQLIVSKAAHERYQRSFDVQGQEVITENVTLQRDAATAPLAAPSAEYGFRGPYARLDFLGMFPTTQANSVHDGRVYGQTSTTDIGLGLGGGLGLRVGHSFGMFGVEGLAAATYDYASVTVSDPSLVGTGGPYATQGRTDDWFFHRVGGTFAAGGRFIGETMFRPTVGAAIGFSYKSVAFRREVRDAGTRNASDSELYLTPTLVFDAGIELGSRTTTRFFLGLNAHLDLPRPQTIRGSSVTTGENALPTGTLVRAATGPELFLGPILGFRFGH